MSEDKMREEFEKWAQPPNGSYLDAESAWKACAESYEQKLAKAKQRELELLAVIGQMKRALEPFAESPELTNLDNAPCHNGITTRDKCGRCGKGLAAYYALNIEPSHALREHEAKLMAEFEKLNVLNSTAEEWRKG